MNKRGPDGTGEWSDTHFFAKHYRLAIIGDKASGAQPMLSHSARYVICFNGEIYNYKELATEQLKDSALIQLGDTRVLTEYLDRFGINGIGNLNGMFAIVIYDRQTHQIFLARDQFGIKPLFWCRGSSGQVYVASEPKSLFHQVKELGYRAEAIEEYLRYGQYPQESNTFFKDIFQVEPGSIKTFHPEETNKKYFDLVSSTASIGTKFSSVEEFEYLLEDSIRLRLRSDIPVSLHLSGGTDSVALLLKTKDVWGEKFPLVSFTLGYRADIGNESKIAETVCHQLGVENRLIDIRADEVPKLTEELLEYTAEPTGGLHSVGQFRLNQYERNQGFIVSLVGQGGDEILGGYRGCQILAGYETQSPELRKSIASSLGLSETQLHASAEQFIASGFGSHVDLTDPRPRIAPPKKLGNSWLYTYCLKLIQKDKIPRGMHFEDRFSMATSREARFPFLDHRLVICGLHLSDMDRFRTGVGKFPLNQIISRRISSFSFTKRSIQAPQTLWLTTELADWVTDEIQSLRSRKSIPERYFRNADVLMATPDLQNSFLVWQLLNLSLLLKRMHICGELREAD